MIKVGISGANGTMGRLTIGAIEAVDDLTIGGLYAPGHAGHEILGHIHCWNTPGHYCSVF